MDFKGKAKRIEDVDLPRVGSLIGVGEDAVHAVIDVESSGSGFDSQGRPKMLFEPHVFYRNIFGSERTEAVNAGLAYPNWKPGNYPKDSYPRLQKAMTINVTAALKAASWGLGQILGENYIAAGYDTPMEMVLDFMDDEDNHLEAMIQFIRNRGLGDELRALEAAKTREAMVAAARGFARGYNGSSYATNNYHNRIVDRFLFWRSKPDTPWNPADAVIEEVTQAPSPGTEDVLIPDGQVSAPQAPDFNSFIKLLAAFIGWLLKLAPKGSVQ